MHVTELLDTFVLGPNIEIIKPFLPDVLRGALGHVDWIASLCLDQNTSRKSKLKRLHHGRRILLLRFADQQVNVFGHDDVTNDHELVAFAHALQHRQEQVATARRGEKGLSSITTAGDEVQVSGAVVAF